MNMTLSLGQKQALKKPANDNGCLDCNGYALGDDFCFACFDKRMWDGW